MPDLASGRRRESRRSACDWISGRKDSPGGNCFGGAMAGLGGVFIALVQTPLWLEGMTAGRGWIALAIVVFAAWTVARPGWRSSLAVSPCYNLTFRQLVFPLPANTVHGATHRHHSGIGRISADETRARLSAPACLGKVFSSLGRSD